MSEATSETALELTGIVKTFEQGGNRLEVLRGASLSLEEGGVLARAATTLVWATGIQTAVMLVWMALKDRAELVAVARAWRPALLVGLVPTADPGAAGMTSAVLLGAAAWSLSRAAMLPVALALP